MHINTPRKKKLWKKLTKDRYSKAVFSIHHWKITEKTPEHLEISSHTFVSTIAAKKKESPFFMTAVLTAKLVKTSLSCWVSNNLNLSQGWMSTSVYSSDWNSKKKVVQFVKPIDDTWFLLTKLNQTKYERNQQFWHVWEQKYLSRCYNNSYEQPKFLWYSQPHSQTFHQVRQGVMPLHLGKQGTKGGTKHETGWLMMPLQVVFFQIRHWLMLPNLQWCLVFVRKCRKNVTIFMDRTSTT